MEEIVEERVQFSVERDMCEGILAYPENQAPQSTMLFLSPHPLLGGDMNNNVIRHLAQRCAEEGAATLRFNYRGVGASTLDKTQEKSSFAHFRAMEATQSYHLLLPEAEAATRYIEAAVETAGPPIFVGYSLGCLLAGMLSHRHNSSSIACISPPNQKVDLTPLLQCPADKVFIGGTHDPFFNAGKFLNLFEQMPLPKTLLEFSEADHFYRQQEENLFMTLRPFLFPDRSSS